MDGRPGKAAAPSRRAGQQAQEDAAARSGRADGRRTDRRNGRQTEDRDDGTELGSRDGGSGRTAPRGAATGSRRGLLLRRAAAPPPTTAAGRAEMRTDGCCCCYDAPAAGRWRWTGAEAADLPGGRLNRPRRGKKKFGTLLCCFDSTGKGKMGLGLGFAAPGSKDGSSRGQRSGMTKGGGPDLDRDLLCYHVTNGGLLY